MLRPRPRRGAAPMASSRLPSILLAALVAAPVQARAQATPDIPPPAAKPATPPPAVAPPPKPGAAAKPDAPKPDAPKSDAPKPDAPKSDAPKSDAPTAAVRTSSAAASTPRRSAGRLAPTPWGDTGVLRVASAEAMPVGHVRLSFGLDMFSADGFIAEGDQASRVAGTLALSYAPVRPLELRLNTRATATRNALSRPELIQSQGDLGLGAKLSFAIGDIGHVGADAQITFLSGVGANSFDPDATEVRLRALLSSDLMRATEKIPLRAHFNLGVTFDRSASLIADLSRLTRAEQFALGLGDFHRLGVGFAIEVPVKYVTPYLEYTAELPLGYLATPGVVIRGSALRPAQVAPGATRTLARPAYGRIVPQRLTPGVRVTAIPDLTLDLAVEIGLTPEVTTGVPGVPPYNVFLFASYAIDPFAARDRGPPLALPVLLPEPRPPEGRVTGRVLAKADRKPVPGAVIAFDRGRPVATDAEGRFESHPFAPGPLRLEVRRDGYLTATASVALAAGASEVEVLLAAEVRNGKVRGRVVDDQDAPLAGAVITLAGATAREVRTGTDGAFELEAPAGKYTLSVELPGFLQKSREVELASGAALGVDLLVRKRPKEALVEARDGLIVLRGQVHFVTGEARLAPDASALLDNLVDFLVGHPAIKRVRVEGHTDNVGSPAANRELSQARAASVVAYLVQQGIAADRLVAEGFGPDRPIAPNLTRRGREQNRRVEFHIVEK
jgi:OOP family OmpA-OmpF porin